MIRSLCLKVCLVFSPIDFRCKRSTGGRGGSSTSSTTSSSATAISISNSSNSGGGSNNSSSGTTGKGNSSSSRSDKSSRPTRVPFHKRRLMALPFEGLGKVQSSSTQSQPPSYRAGAAMKLPVRPESGVKAVSAAGSSSTSQASKSTSLFNILLQRLVPALWRQINTHFSRVK